MPELSNKVDLHLHSTESDGVYSPTELVEMASSSGLSAIALTDHETTKGVNEAINAGNKFALEVIPGVEISVGYKSKELHILGYFPQKFDKLETVLYDLRDGRYTRIAQMIEILNKMSVAVSWEDIKKEIGNAAPGRLHLARVLFKKGYVSSLEEAFNKYLDRGRPVYIPRLRLKTKEAIELLIECNAVPVLAHPGITSEGVQTLQTLKSEGIKGIEVYHPEHSRGQTLFYEQLARQENLLITGGSDFHGDEKNSTRDLNTTSFLGIDYTYLELLKVFSKKGNTDELRN